MKKVKKMHKVEMLSHIEQPIIFCRNFAPSDDVRSCSGRTPFVLPLPSRFYGKSKVKFKQIKSYGKN